MNRTKYIEDAALLSLHAAHATGLRQGTLAMMLPLIGYANVAIGRFINILKGMVRNGLVLMKSDVVEITPEGITRLQAMGLI